MKWLRKLSDKIFRRKKEDEPGVYLVKEVYDPELGGVVLVELLCLCGWHVSPFEAGEEYNYWCEHCDRSCTEGLPTCYYCGNLASADIEEIRNRYKRQDED